MKFLLMMSQMVEMNYRMEENKSCVGDATLRNMQKKAQVNVM